MGIAVLAVTVQLLRLELLGTPLNRTSDFGAAVFGSFYKAGTFAGGPEHFGFGFFPG